MTDSRLTFGFLPLWLADGPKLEDRPPLQMASTPCLRCATPTPPRTSARKHNRCPPCFPFLVRCHTFRFPAPDRQPLVHNFTVLLDPIPYTWLLFVFEPMVRRKEAAVFRPCSPAPPFCFTKYGRSSISCLSRIDSPGCLRTDAVFVLCSFSAAGFPDMCLFCFRTFNVLPPISCGISYCLYQRHRSSLWALPNPPFALTRLFPPHLPRQNGAKPEGFPRSRFPHAPYCPHFPFFNHNLFSLNLSHSFPRQLCLR